MWPFNRTKTYWIREFNKSKINPKVSEWANRVTPDYDPYVKPLCANNLQTMERVLKHVKSLYVNISDWDQYKKLDYWPTPSEMLQSIYQTGKFYEDCDGFAILTWQLLFSLSFPPNDIGMAFAKGPKQAHMFCCYHDIKIYPDFWVLDNGYLASKVTRASKAFPCTRNGGEVILEWGFNNYYYWNYIKKSVNTNFLLDK